MFSSVRYHSKKSVFWMLKEPVALYYRIDNSFNDFREITRSEDRTPKVQRTIFARMVHLNVKSHWSVHSHNIRHQCFQMNDDAANSTSVDISAIAPNSNNCFCIDLIILKTSNDTLFDTFCLTLSC